MYNFVLASQSPRRAQILKELGFQFDIIVSGADENISYNGDSKDYVQQLSQIKARAVVEKMYSENYKTSAIVIAADTVVVNEEKILGKPKDKEDCIKMMQSLSGHAHKVLSGVTLALYDPNKNIEAVKFVCDNSETKVVFRELSSAEVLAYASTKEPYDKAGGYGIQGLASVFVKEISGDYFGVVGLPVATLVKMLHENFDFSVSTLFK